MTKNNILSGENIQPGYQGEEKMSSNKKTARIAGVLFLLMVVFGLAAEIFFRQKIFAPSDITVTANNILSNVFLYRVGIVSDILMTLSYMLTALVLYKLFSSVQEMVMAGWLIVKGFNVSAFHTLTYNNNTIES